jgi:hypothetical protein
MIFIFVICCSGFVDDGGIDAPAAVDKDDGDDACKAYTWI